MKQVDIITKTYENKKIENTSNLKQINNLQDFQLTNLNGIIIEKYDNNIFVLKQSGKELGYVKGQNQLKLILNELEKKNNIKIKTGLKLQGLGISVENNPKAPTGQKNIDFTRNNLSKYSVKVLAGLYEDSHTDSLLKKDIVANLKERIFDVNTSFDQKKKILKLFKNTKIYDELVISVLGSLKNQAEGDEFLHLVGKDNLQQAIKNHFVDDNFVEQFYIHYTSSDDVRGYPVNCSKNIDKDSCNSFFSYIYALGKTSNNPFFNYSIVGSTISKAFDNNLSFFKEKILPVFDYYKKTKGKLLKNGVDENILKQKGLIGVIQNALDKTNMTEGQKQFRTSRAPLGLAVGAIFVMFKYFKKFGVLNGILDLVGGNIALEATTGESILLLVNKLVYGGFDMSSLTKKNQDKTKEITDGNKEYQNILGFPSFTNMIFGDNKLSSLSSYIKYTKDGTIKKFDVKTYIKNLKDTDWRKAFLQQMGIKKVETIFVKGLNQLGIKSSNFDSLKGEKINELYQKYLDGVSKKKSKGQNISTSATSITPADTSSPSDSTSSDKKVVVPTISNSKKGGDQVLGTTSEVVGIPNTTNEAQYLRLNYQNTKVLFTGNSLELQQEIKQKLEANLGTELYSKLNKKLKELQNLQLFNKYMKIYAKINNYQDLGDFTYGFHFWDEMPIFVKGAYFSDYRRLFGYIIKAAIKGKTKTLNILLKGLSDKNILDSLVSINDAMVSNRGEILSTQKDRENVLNMLKTGSQADIEGWFAEKMKDPTFIQNDVIGNVVLKGLTASNLVDGSINNAVNEVYKALDDFTLFGKQISLSGKKLSKNEIKSTLEDFRKQYSNLGRNQRFQIIYAGLVKKQLDKLEGDETFINQFKLEQKKKLELYYKNNDSWDNFKKHWVSYLMKGTLLVSTAVVTDGLITSILPEGAVLGMGGVRFVARVVALQNATGDMSLLLNDQLTAKNAGSVLTNLDGYIHTAAYMTVLEGLAWGMGKLGKLDSLKKIGGKLETLGKGKFNLKNFALYGINVGGILTLDTVVFDGKFTPEEMVNALMFAALMGKTDIKIEKGNDGEIKIVEGAMSDPIEFYKNPKTGITYTKTLDGKWFNSKGKELKKQPSNIVKLDKVSIELKINEITKELENLKDERTNINEQIKELENQKNNSKIIGSENFYNEKIKKLQLEFNNLDQKINILEKENNELNNLFKEIDINLGIENDLTSEKTAFSKKVEPEKLTEEKIIDTMLKNLKKGKEYNLEASGVNIGKSSSGDFYVEQNGEVTSFKDIKELKKYIEDNNLENGLLMTKLLESIKEGKLEKKMFEKKKFAGTNLYLGKKEIDFSGKTYKVAKTSDGKYYMVEKGDKGWKVGNKIELDKFIDDNPKFVEEIFINGFERFLKENNLLDKNIIPKGAKIPKGLKISNPFTGEKMLKFLKEKTGVGKALSSDQKFRSLIKLALTGDVKGLEGIKEAGFWKGGVKSIFFICIWLYTLNNVVNDWGHPFSVAGDLTTGVAWNAFTTIMGIYEGLKIGFEHYEGSKTVSGGN